MNAPQLKCPRDGAELDSKLYEADVTVDACRSCRGMWLDRGELERAQQALANEHSARLLNIEEVAAAYEMARQKLQPAIACPRCSTPLVAREYGYCSRILIDACSSCRGIWLDAGEIEALERFFEREREHSVRQGFWASLLDRLG